MERELKPKYAMVTYCLVCGSALYWDEEGAPMILRVGDANLVTCLETGCTMVYASTENRGGNFELFRRSLVEAGIPEDLALSIAAVVATQNVHTAAA